ncbi:MAG: hypothetical protein K8L99_15100 [Anaerolineae bacterium]|nr:hypothetical protein [Anaerolineae bacterium]
MPRIIFTVTDEMEADLKDQARKSGATLSGLIRLYLTEKLIEKTGKPVSAYEVETGGDRSKDE